MLSFYVLLYFVTIVILLIGSVEDFKKREIPDFLNYFFVISILGLRLLYSIINLNYIYFIEGILGFLVFFFIAVFMYYSGQWGGGDSKMLLGLGAFFGLTLPMELSFDYFFGLSLFNYLILMFLVGAVYAIIWTIVVTFLNFKKVFKKYSELFFSKFYLILRRIIFGTVFLFFLISFLVSVPTKIVIFSFSLITIIMYFLFLLLKSVETVAMIKAVDVNLLTEGDWVVEDVFYNKKKVCGPDDLGLTLDQISKLKKYKIKKVKIKQGIPFVPSFLMAFLIWAFNQTIVFSFFR